jgi:uncharacterized damage-inducible protein DinB
VNAGDLRYLFDYDRWATALVLEAASGLPAAAWPTGGPVGDRELADILVHHLGASQRWRHGLSGTPDSDLPRPEREPLPSIAELVDRWAAEWVAREAWLATLDDDWLAATEDGVTHWQMLVHVVNHGTQHRSEAAVLLTGAGRSPGDLDMIDYAESRATER